MDTKLGTFLGQLKEEGLLQNSDLEKTIRSRTSPAWNLDEGQQTFLRNVLRETNARESGVYTTAAIVLGLLNSR